MNFHLRDIPNYRLLFSGRYLRRAVGENVGEHSTTPSDVKVGEVREILSCFSIELGHVGAEKMIFCAAITCSNHSKYKESSFKFPDKLKIQKEWLKTALKSKRQLTKHSRFFRDHFFLAMAAQSRKFRGLSLAFGFTTWEDET